MMKKAILGLIAGASLASSNASADKIGAHFGFPGLGFHYAIGNVFGPQNDLRFSVNLPFAFNFLWLEADAMLGHMSLGSSDFSLYYGAGAHAGLGFNGGAFFAGAHALGGVEYSFTPMISAYLDARLGATFGNFLGFSSGFGIYYGGQLGVNFKI